MGFTRTDANALLAIALGAIVGIGAFGPHHWGTSHTTTTTVTTTDIVIPATPVPFDLHEQVVIARGNVFLESNVFPESATIVGEHAVVSIEPLVYLDGARIMGGIPDIDAETIERVEVLKGTAAIDAYGPEAVVGVVQIFSKQGSSPIPGG